MNDEELKLEEIEESHTLGGTGKVTRAEGRGEGVDDTLLSVTLSYNNLTGLEIRQVVLR